MRREIKVGILVSLSAALVAAVFIGKLLSSDDEELLKAAVVQNASALEEPTPNVGGGASSAAAERELLDILRASEAGKWKAPERPDRPLTAPASTVATDPIAADAGLTASGTPVEADDLFVEEKKAAESAPADDKGSADFPDSEIDDTLNAIDEILKRLDKEVEASNVPREPTPKREKTETARLETQASEDNFDAFFRDVEKKKPAPVVQPKRADDIRTLEEVLRLDEEQEADHAGGRRTYVVEPGESLWVVAKKVYGKGHLWRHILAANPAIGDPDDVLSGTRLVIPPLDDAAPQAQEVELPPGARAHTVAKGEVLWDIAQKYYGKGWEWRHIAQANPNIDPHMLPEGAVLIVPELTRKQPASAPEVQALPPGYRVHVIEKGDMLWDIAYKYLGSGKHYRLILQHNPDVVDVHNLQVGKVLVIPPRPKEETPRF